MAQPLPLKSYYKAWTSVFTGVCILLSIPFTDKSLYGLNNAHAIDSNSFVNSLLYFLSKVGVYDTYYVSIAGFDIRLSYILSGILLFVSVYFFSMYKGNMRDYKRRFYGQKFEDVAFNSLVNAGHKTDFKVMRDDTFYKGVGDIDAILYNGRTFTVEIKSQGGAKLSGNGNSITRLNGNNFIKDYLQQTLNASNAYNQKYGVLSTPVLWFPRGKGRSFKARGVVVINGNSDTLLKKLSMNP